MCRISVPYVLRNVVILDPLGHECLRKIHISKQSYKSGWVYLFVSARSSRQVGLKGGCAYRLALKVGERIVSRVSVGHVLLVKLALKVGARIVWP